MQSHFHWISPEVYLESERKASVKSEYFQGQRFAVAHANHNHCAITVNLIRLIHTGLRGKTCTFFHTDMRLHIPENGLYTYPDAMVVCGKKEFLDDKKDTLTNPVLIIEVLSDSTESYDRGRKFGFYRSIPTFREYLLVNAQRANAELYRKNEAGLWELHESPGLAGSQHLSSVHFDLSLRDLYEGTEDLQP